MRILVLPAASKPSINNRISFDPKILFIIFEIEPPIAPAVYDTPAEAIDRSSIAVDVICMRVLCGLVREGRCSIPSLQ